MNEMFDVYSGILFNNQKFKKDNNKRINYTFNCKEYNELKDKYDLEKIAGNDSDLSKGIKLLHYLAPRLAHSSFYDNHVECNALALLEYSLNNKEHGINCLNKSKILEECCLALGIYARRVRIMPYSPFDLDNHVVVEIYDKKWIMLDPSTDGIFVDENKVPLSLLEIRDKLVNNEFVTFVKSDDKFDDLEKLREEYLDMITYICKNSFYFVVDNDSTFGYTNKTLTFTPINYSIKNKTIANLKYRIKNIPKEYDDLIIDCKKKLEETINSEEIETTNIESFIKSPYWLYFIVILNL